MTPSICGFYIKNFKMGSGLMGNDGVYDVWSFDKRGDIKVTDTDVEMCNRVISVVGVIVQGLRKKGVDVSFNTETANITDYTKILTNMLVELNILHGMVEGLGGGDAHNGYYIAGVKGGSWILGKNSIGTEYFVNELGANNLADAFKLAGVYVRGEDRKNKKVYALAILRGDFTWDLSRAQYIDLYSGLRVV